MLEPSKRTAIRALDLTWEFPLESSILQDVWDFRKWRHARAFGLTEAQAFVLWPFHRRLLLNAVHCRVFESVPDNHGLGPLAFFVALSFALAESIPRFLYTKNCVELFLMKFCSVVQFSLWLRRLHSYVSFISVLVHSRIWELQHVIKEHTAVLALVEICLWLQL